MYIALDAKGEQITASLIDLHDGSPVISVEVTNLIGLNNSAWLYPSAARELAEAIIARCDEIETAAGHRQLVADLQAAVHDYQANPQTAERWAFARRQS